MGMLANKPCAYFILHYLLCIIYVTNYILHFQDDFTYCNMDCMRYLQMQYTLDIMHYAFCEIVAPIAISWVPSEVKASSSNIANILPTLFTTMCCRCSECSIFAIM